MTNFERIKEKDISELARFIAYTTTCDICPNCNCKGTSIESPPISICVRSFKKWLESDEIKEELEAYCK